MRRYAMQPVIMCKYFEKIPKRNDCCCLLYCYVACSTCLRWPGRGRGGSVGRGRCLCGRALAYSKQIIYRYVCIRDVCKLCVENRKVLPSHTRIVSTHMRLFRNHHHCCSCCSYSLVWKCSIFEIAYSIASIGIIWEKQEKQKSLGCFFFSCFFFIFSFIIISMSFGKFMFAEVISILFSSYLLFIQHMRPHLMLVS